MTVIRCIDYVISILTEPVNDFTVPNEVHQAKTTLYLPCKFPLSRGRWDFHGHFSV